MSDLMLLPIGRDGTVAGAAEALPELAQDVCRTCRLLYDTAGYRPPWIGYLARVDGHIVGSCAFKGPPARQRLEIACFTFPDYEGVGFATAMVRALVDIVARRLPGAEVVAQTQPEENAAAAVLKKLGFRHRGLVAHPEDGPVWEWTLSVGEN